MEIKHDDSDIPWVEKYRPKSIDDIKSQSLTIRSLKEFVKKKSLPHLIFTGPAGTGKTSTAYALIHDLMGIETLTQDLILERNASDESRMQDLPEIKHFVFHTKFNEKAPFKFVILDESDNLSSDVQSAFRRIIEMAPPNVKFIFLCNYVERIIDPILSRCAIFRFYPLPKKDFIAQLKFIAKQEKIKPSAKVFAALYYISQGDMRKAINLFQTIAAVERESKEDVLELNIRDDIIYEISGFLTPYKLSLLSNLIYSDAELNDILEFVKNERGLSSRGFFREISDLILRKEKTFPKREKILSLIADYDYRLTLEADPEIQLDGCLADIVKIIRYDS